VAHLAVVEGRLGALVASKIAEARGAGLGAETELSPIEPTMDLDALADRSRKLTASEAVRPPADADTDAALAKLHEHRDQLKHTLHLSDGLALGQVVAPHPRLGPLNVYQWCFFIGGHEARHADQIRECGEFFKARLAEQDESGSAS
jgi:hypothetical protein